MAVGFPAGITEAYVVNNAQSKLAALRRALEDCADFYSWLASYSASDLEADPIDMDAASAQAIFNAFADASFLAGLANGADPGDHPFPYNFLTSMRVVIGPLS
jgi:hypothetical protein